MKWVLLILYLTGDSRIVDPRIVGPLYEDRSQCDVEARRFNTQSAPGAWAHCLPLPT